MTAGSVKMVMPRCRSMGVRVEEGVAVVDAAEFAYVAR